MNDFDMDAALYALGTLSGEDYERARRCAESDSTWGAVVADHEAALAPMAAACAPVAPPDDLLARIEARLDRAATGTTSRADAARWVEVSPGMRVRVLSKSPETRRRTILLDVAPGAIYEAHDHDDDEEIYMISGDLRIGDLDLGPGDHHFAPRGSRHPRATSRQGCVCLIVCAI